MPEKAASYVIVTPCKNEESNLPYLIKSILAQTIKPVLWVVVDDGSTDNSEEILNELEKKYTWVKIIRLSGNKEYLGAHISRVYNEGFEFIKNYSAECSIEWEYLAVLDSDTILEPEYFEKLILKLRENPKLGIASGFTSEYTENISPLLDRVNAKIDITDPTFWATYPFSLKGEMVRKDLPTGSARIYKKKCFEETGGRYENINLPDGISTIRAKIKGWETACFPEFKVIERKGLVARGDWYGYKDRGSSNYAINLPPYIMILKALNYSFKKPYYIGVAYIWGYLESLIFRRKQLKDEEVLKYYRSKHLNETKKYYIERIQKSLFKKRC